MLALEASCYLALVAATCGACVAGRGARGAFAWLRRGALVLLAAVLMAVEARLIALGLVREGAGLVAAGVALAGVLSLMGLDLLPVRAAGSPASAGAASPRR